MKVAFTEIGGCGGCSLSFFRASPELTPNWDLAYHPLQLNTGKIPETAEVFFISGAICAQDGERVELLKRIRANAKTVIAFGSCAAVGGIMRFFVRGVREPRAWQSTHLPLGEFINCDLAALGCPPPPQSITRVLYRLSAPKKDGVNPYAKLSKITHLSCFDLLDDIVNPKLCIGCGFCQASCPTLAIQIIDGVPEFIVERCIRCGLCYARCPQVIKKWKKEAE